MNYVILQEGESMFLGPNVPHAYIFGGIGHARTHAPYYMHFYDVSVCRVGGE